MVANKGLKRKSLTQQNETPNKKVLNVQSSKQAKIHTPAKKNVTSPKSLKVSSATNKRNKGKALQEEEEEDDDESGSDNENIEDLDKNIDEKEDEDDDEFPSGSESGEELDTNIDESDDSEDDSDDIGETESDKIIVESAKLNQSNKTTSSSYTVFVGHLNYATVAEELLEHFKETCQVVNVRLSIKNDKNPGFGFVQLKDELSYKKALKLDHSSLGGAKINVEPARQNFDEAKAKNAKKAVAKQEVIKIPPQKSAKPAKQKQAKKKQVD